MKIDELVTKLQVQLAALGDGRDAKSDNERTAYWHRYTAMQQTISGLRNIENDFAKPRAQLAAVELQRAEVLAKQAEIEALLADAPDWRSFADGRARDREYSRQDGLRTSLRLLKEGALWSGPGTTFPPLDYLDQRIAELNQKLSQKREQHDAHVEAAEALLGETVTT